MKRQLIITTLLLLLSNQAIFAQSCNNTVTATTPDNRFTIVAGEVKDSKTGLIWQRCSLGQSGTDCSQGDAQKYTWSEALQAAKTEQQTTGVVWRLPNIKELRSIVEQQCDSPAINLTVFPDTSSSYYWSASPHAGYSYSAWHVYFGDGNSFYYFDKDGSFLSVRLVRAGQ